MDDFRCIGLLKSISSLVPAHPGQVNILAISLIHIDNLFEGKIIKSDQNEQLSMFGKNLFFLLLPGNIQLFSF